ncbi:hypothetical protein BDK51DRAFT_44102 [Blyttiomyces helicus]|uniref:Uncharacterized protein n=1 Tax=Blyttiomyces helicus TaxID=388810 RepID=A0A4P9WPB8_9FUNG|nr:hypothetical protein BDK51DRAFT_44102 [Blyttiomyces helicus]|eukprot:RKO93080.1 hypothetical protein BDK51DRAFT_44102 [Blyttiomyces helicus]
MSITVPTLQDSRYKSFASSIASSYGGDGLIRSSALSMAGGLTNVGVASRSAQILPASLTRSVCRPISSFSRPSYTANDCDSSSASSGCTGSPTSPSSAELEAFHKRMEMMADRIDHGEDVFDEGVTAQYEVAVEQDLAKSGRSGGKIRKFLHKKYLTLLTSILRAHMASPPAPEVVNKRAWLIRTVLILGQRRLTFPPHLALLDDHSIVRTDWTANRVKDVCLRESSLLKKARQGFKRDYHFPITTNLRSRARQFLSVREVTTQSTCADERSPG